MWITPTKEHGPIAGKKIAPGEWEIAKPGEPIEFPDDKAKKLINAGKAVPCDPPKEKPKPIKSKKGESKDGGSSDNK